MDGIHVVRSSEGDTIDSWQFKATGDQTHGMFDLMVGEIDYLTGPPLHTHAEQADTFYILSGVLKIQIGDSLIDLERGDFATVPPGVPHTFDNVRKDQPPVKAINIMTPGGFAHALEAYNRQGSDALSPAEFEKEFGVAIVGPSLRSRLQID